MINSCEAKKVSDVLCALFDGCCPNDDSLLEKLRTWLESSLNDAGSHCSRVGIKSNQIKILVLLTAANTVKGMEDQKESDILHHP